MAGLLPMADLSMFRLAMQLMSNLTFWSWTRERMIYLGTNGVYLVP